MSERMIVAAAKAMPACYPTRAPYHPSSAYPEYPFLPYLSPESNAVYAGVRRLLCILGLDKDRFGIPEWNPLGFLLEPGMKVVLKPNFVASRHKGSGELYSIITHPSVLRAIADYCWIAMRGEGQIIIADAPQYDCNWQELVTATGLGQILELYGAGAVLLDLRSYWSRGKHFPSLLEPLPGDPRGTVWVDLGRRSAFQGMRADRMVGACYWRDELAAHHQEGVHEYALSRTVLEADAIISVPKLKVHKKVGVTLNVKNLVGICTDKNCLPHYRLGSPSEGGDQYPDGLFAPMEQGLIRTERWMYDHLLAPRSRILERLHRSVYWLHNHTTRRLGLKVSEYRRMFDAGNWYGNDTAWRMAADLFTAFTYADSDGRLRDQPQRRAFSVVDGVVGGQLGGPLTPMAMDAGILLAGDDLLAVDLAASCLMDFDPTRIPLYRHLLGDADGSFIDIVGDHDCDLIFVPPPGWQGHMEMGP